MMSPSRRIVLSLASIALAAALVFPLMPSPDEKPEQIVAETEANVIDVKATEPSAAKRSATRSVRNETATPDQILRYTHESAEDLEAFYAQMLEASKAGDGEASYRAALALHECALAIAPRSAQQTCDAANVLDVFPEKRLACENSTERCAGFADQSPESLNIMRDELYALAAEQGYPRAVARQLSTLMEDDPDTAEELARELLAETDDFGTLYHVGNFLELRLHHANEPWIGNAWADDSSRIGPSSRWGKAAWDLAACGVDHGCTEQTIFMRNACQRGDGCQAGWAYEDYLRYYRSPYDFARIQAMSQEISLAMRERDIDRLLGADD